MFHDGKPVLAGFLLSDKPVAEDRWFVVQLASQVFIHTMVGFRYPKSPEVGSPIRSAYGTRKTPRNRKIRLRPDKKNQKKNGVELVFRRTR
jgi:hypothetical protein